MAGWISSKLKVAENFLQQIDQQAAESLGKGDSPPSPRLLDEDGDGSVQKKEEPLPLKLQFHRKPPERGRDGRSPMPAESNLAKHPPARSSGLVDTVEASLHSMPVASSAEDVAAAMDGDWTKLLSSPKSINPAGGSSGGSSPSPRAAKKVAIPKRRGFIRPGREVATLGAGENEQYRLSSSHHNGSDSSSEKRSGDGIIVSKMPAGSLGSANSAKGESIGEFPRDVDILTSESIKNVGETSDSVTLDMSMSTEGRQGSVFVPKVDKCTGDKEADHVGFGGDGRNDIQGRRQSTKNLQISPPRLLPRVSPSSGGSSESDSESTSTSDSEYESEKKIEKRKRRERILSEKAAAMAAEAIKEQENLVAKLEGEKESLEKVLEERQKQQAQEASQLQMSVMEAMEAVDLEKQKHNSTRMEALARLSELETRNAELAKSLATAQWDLEVEVKQVVILRELVESKELAQEELRKKISDVDQNAVSSKHIEASKADEYEHKIIEAELSFICDKIIQLKEKARSLERNIEMTKELMHPTDVEVELKKRLKQLTDNLIQKQAQVESLSSEKATLLFRIETISRLLEDNGVPLQLSGATHSGASLTELPADIDIEAGTEVPSYSTSTLKPLLRERINSGGQQIGSFLRQLDAIFAAGFMFLKRSPTAQMWSFVYLICLHLWVIYILKSHSQTSHVTSSGAVFSLENINKTS